MKTNGRSTVREIVEDKPVFVGQLLQIHPVDLGIGLIKIGPEKFVIGRDSKCSLTILEDSVSRSHSRIELEGTEYRITDLGSTNGTWVNQIAIDTAVLECGDRIRIGNRILKFLATDKVESQYYEAVYSMMTKDSMTGAWNKCYFNDMFERELKRRQRSKRPLALLMIDVDRFKRINDKHGHLVGDEVLTEIARRISFAIREDDIFARFGGEEFALALYDADEAEALVVAERCRVAVEMTPIHTKIAGPINCSISVGVAVVTETNPFLTMEDLVKAADTNLYRAKEAGRNQVCGAF